MIIFNNRVYSGNYTASGSGYDPYRSAHYASTGSGVIVTMLTLLADGSVSGNWSWNGAYATTGGNWSESGGSSGTGTVSGTYSDLLFVGAGSFTVTAHGALGEDGRITTWDATWTDPTGSGGASAVMITSGVLPGNEGSPGNDTFLSTPGDEAFNGKDGNDTVSYAPAPAGVTVDLSMAAAQITGCGSDTLGSIENLIGSSHNDFFSGNGFDNAIDGGAGIDTAVYLSARSSYTVAVNGAGITVTSLAGAADGTDQLANVERLQFSDRKLAFDLAPAGHAGQAAEFIGMLAPDTLANPQIVGMILGYFDAGTSMTALSQLAIDAGLVAQLAGSNSQADLARLVFRNVIGAEADAATVDALVAYMDGRTDDMSRAEFMAAVAGLEVNQTHVNLVGLQATGIAFV
jgi:hypothetical protein